ncbi:MAG TPA: RhuM family protein [Phycisphaerae bacterium]|nr:RhuM family protein [Phycisphaerae bacterium]HQL71753.1 RhuM family protein [Phycisphaerae bacterium]
MAKRNDNLPVHHAGDSPEGPGGEILLYQTPDGRTRLECRFQDETIWLTQALMAELYQKDVRTINEHLKNIYDEGELDREATIRNYRIVRQEGNRQVAREIEHYSLDAILAVGYRVRSQRGTQFRRWATERLREYLLKGFVMDDERLTWQRQPNKKLHQHVLTAYGACDPARLWAPDWADVWEDTGAGQPLPPPTIPSPPAAPRSTNSCWRIC